MKRHLLLALTFGLLGAASAANPVLTSVPARFAPIIDGIVSEADWKSAPVLNIKTEEGDDPGVANASETSVTMQSVYTSDSVYFLVTWKDPTYSIDRQRWAFDGKTWAKEDQNPLDKGGANTLYEDKIAFMWGIKAPSFEKEGPWATYQNLAAAQAAGYARPVKSAPKGETLDMWHYKLVRNGFAYPGQVDDQFVNDTLDAGKAAEAGRTSDAGGGGYYNNERDLTLPDGRKVKVPKYAFKAGSVNEYIMTQNMIDAGLTYELSDAQVLAMSPGTHIPAVIGRPFTGSRGDITAQFSWRDGLYILEFGRKLNTGDMERDVQFTNLNKTYFYGVATFDNTQIKHAVSDLIEFKFGK